jgi:hypothetical protein
MYLFFYENVNLNDQFILRNNLRFTHVVWNRDGTSLGGGSVSHDFLFPLGAKRERNIISFGTGIWMMKV